MRVCVQVFCFFIFFREEKVEHQGFDPCTSCLQSTHSTDWANAPTKGVLTPVPVVASVHAWWAIEQKKHIPGGTWTPNLLIRSQTPYPIGPQGLYNMWPLRLSTLLILKLILGPKKGYCRNRNSDHRICNPMLYRWAKHPWSRYAKVEPSYFFFNISAQNQWKKRQRGRAGIEPATSRTRSENHTTRPTARNNSLRLLWLMEKKCRWLRSGSATPTL